MLTQSYVKQVFEYNPETGDLIWRERPAELFKNAQAHKAWNTRYSGKTVSTIHHEGYLVTTLCGRPHLAHRLIWLLETGEWPDKIDHINGVRSDNRWVNIRSVTNAENRKNMALQTNNKSGIPGVQWYAPTQRWLARIYCDKRQYNLGYFKEISEAAASRKEAEERFGFHKNHGRTAA